MKRLICVLTATVFLFLMTACNVTTNFSDTTGNSTMQSVEKVEQMMEALSDGDTQAALELMHPDVAEGASDAIAQMEEYIASRKVSDMQQMSLTVNSSSGTKGNVRQEKGGFRVELEDNTVFYISVTHISNSDGEGFSSFQLVLGVI